MDQWIAALIGYATAPLRDLIAAVSQRISWVFNLITRVLRSVKLATARLYDGAAAFRNWVAWGIGEAFLTMKWLVTIRIPAVIANARDTVIQWATQTINTVRAGLVATIAALDRSLRGIIASIFNDLSALKRWALDQLAPIIDDLRRVRDTVFNLLTSPKRLASWIVGAMVEELWAYANRNGDRIAQWMRGKSVQYTLQAAGQIESIIARIL